MAPGRRQSLRGLVDLDGTGDWGPATSAPPKVSLFPRDHRGSRPGARRALPVLPRAIQRIDQRAQGPGPRPTHEAHPGARGKLSESLSGSSVAGAPDPSDRCIQDVGDDAQKLRQGERLRDERHTSRPAERVRVLRGPRGQRHDRDTSRASSYPRWQMTSVGIRPPSWEALQQSIHWWQWPCSSRSVSLGSRRPLASLGGSVSV